MRSHITESQEPGLSTSDMNASEATLRSLAQLLDVHVIHLRDRTVSASAAASSSTGGGGGRKRQRKRPGHNASAEETTLDGEHKAENTTTVAPVSSATPAGEWLVKDFLLRRAIGERDFIDIRLVDLHLSC